MVPSLDWHAALFLPDGTVDSGAARAWVATAHEALRRHHGAAWTDAHALWLGRLSHDCLHYQGNSPAELTADDLDDLLLTLTPAQRASVPAPPAVAVPALRLLFAFGAAVHGSLAARDALTFLDDDVEQAFLEAMRPPEENRLEPAKEAPGEPQTEPQPETLSRAERRAREGSKGRGRVKVRRKPGRRSKRRR
jgi:hypothetical protein